MPPPGLCHPWDPIIHTAFRDSSCVVVVPTAISALQRRATTECTGMLRPPTKSTVHDHGNVKVVRTEKRVQDGGQKNHSLGKQEKNARKEEAEDWTENLWQDKHAPNTSPPLIGLKHMPHGIPFPDWWWVQALFCIRLNQSGSREKRQNL